MAMRHSWKATADSIVSSLSKLHEWRKLLLYMQSQREILSLIDNNISKRKQVSSNPYPSRDDIPRLLHL